MKILSIFKSEKAGLWWHITEKSKSCFWHCIGRFSELIIIEPSYPSVKISSSYRFIPACSWRIINSISIISDVSNMCATIDDNYIGLLGIICCSSVVQPAFGPASILICIVIDDVSDVHTAVPIGFSKESSCPLIHFVS